MVTAEEFVLKWPAHRGQWFPENLNNVDDLYNILEMETAEGGKGRESLVKYVHQRYSRLITTEERGDYLEKCAEIQKARAKAREAAKQKNA